MSGAETLDYTSPYWRDSLRRYAERLIDRFGKDLRAFSGTGLSLQAVHRIGLTIDQAKKPAEGQESGFRRPERSPRWDTQRQQSVLDSVFLDKWMGEPRPLLIRAPFGSGKSFLLASFALKLAERLRHWCQLPDGDLPPVPFPVRLREWPAAMSLREYLAQKAQRIIHKEAKADVLLPETAVDSLLDSGHLLPLFDGFDELPRFKSGESHTSINLRHDALDSIWELFADRHILSSRPGHGAEDGGYEKKGSIYELNELNVEQAEAFICDQLKIDPKQKDNPILLQYRSAQPHINNLFRRPLFLAAWCVRADRPVTQPLPNTVSGLMDVVLKQIFDERMGRYRANANTESSLNRLKHYPHRFGAVLAYYADVGFGESVPDQRIGKAILAQHPLAFEGEPIEEYLDDLKQAGLLIVIENHCYTIKIPAVEYLIGCYYAWLAEKQTDDEISPHQEQLVTAFQRRFWWRDHDEVWLYAFDLMWRGHESQWQLAGELIQWVLELSGQCIKSARWEGSLPDDQVESDREPFSCDSFVLRILLPVGIVPTPAQHTIDRLVQLGFDHVEAAASPFLKNGQPESSFERLILSRPKLVLDWLFTRLDDKSYKLGWYEIAVAICRGSTYLKSDAIDRLLKLFDNAEYKEAWNPIAYAIGLTSAHLGDEAVKELLKRLDDPKHKPAWDPLAYSLSLASAHLGDKAIEELLKKLGDPEHKQAWDSIGYTLGQAATHLRSNIVKRLLQLLDNPDRKEAWNSIAYAIAEASTHVGADEVKQLLKHLRDPKHKKAWDSIAYAIAQASMHLEDDGVKQLLKQLKDRKHKQAWSSIASAIGGASTHLETDTVKQLLQHLDNSKYKRAWDSIAFAIGQASAHLQLDGIEQLLEFLDDSQHDQAWEKIGSAIGKAALHLGTDAVNLLLKRIEATQHKQARRFIASAIDDASAHLGTSAVKQLLRHLDDPKYSLAWNAIGSAIGKANCDAVSIAQHKTRADDAARKGRISYATRICNIIPRLIWFVRDINPTAEAGRQIVYGVAERHDPDLLLPSTKELAPKAIRRILGTPTVSEQNQATGIKSDWQENNGAIKLVLEAVGKTAEVNTFKEALESTSTAYGKLRSESSQNNQAKKYRDPQVNVESRPSNLGHELITETPATPRSSRNEFRQLSKGSWQIQFGDEGPLKLNVPSSMKGFVRIVRLLKRPNISVSDMALAADLFNETATELLAESNERRIDETSRRQNEKQLLKLQDELETRIEGGAGKGESPQDHFDRIDQLEEEIQKTEQELNSAARPIDDRTRNTAQTTVSATIERACGRLQDDMPKLAAHLRQHIVQTSGTYSRCYQPPDNVEWDAEEWSPTVREKLIQRRE